MYQLNVLKVVVGDEEIVTPLKIIKLAPTVVFLKKVQQFLEFKERRTHVETSVYICVFKNIEENALYYSQ